MQEIDCMLKTSRVGACCTVVLAVIRRFAYYFWLQAQSAITEAMQMASRGVGEGCGRLQKPSTISRARPRGGTAIAPARAATAVALSPGGIYMSMSVNATTAVNCTLNAINGTSCLDPSNEPSPGRGAMLVLLVFCAVHGAMCFCCCASIHMRSSARVDVECGKMTSEIELGYL